MTKPYHEYAQGYPVAKELIADCLKHSFLSHLENIALRFSYALDEKQLDLKDGNERVFLSAVLTKTVNEMFGTIGTLMNGSLLSSYHHARSVLELFAALDHIYCNSSKRERKLEKFVEYSNVGRYLHFLDWQQRLFKKEVTQDWFVKSCHVSESMFRELEKKLPEWQRIWNLKGKDPKVIQNWHYPATIEGLFESSKETKNIWDVYQILCHATHLSPLSQGVTGGHFLIGFPRNKSGFDYEKINMPIEATILGAQKIALRLWETVEAGQIEGVFDWIPGGGNNS